MKYVEEEDSPVLLIKKTIYLTMKYLNSKRFKSRSGPFVILEETRILKWLFSDLRI